MFNVLKTIICVVLTASLTCQISGAQDLPKNANDVIKRYVKAIGGQKQLKKERKLKISYLVTSTSKQAVPETRSTLFINGKKSVYVGSKGERIWYLTPKQQPWNVRGPIARSLPFYHGHPTALPLFILDYPAELELDLNKSRNTEHYYLRAKPIFDDPKSRNTSPKCFLMDKKTGLLTKIIFPIRSLEFNDYREYDGLLIPHETIAEYRVAIKAKFRIKTTEIVSDFEYEPKLFDLPKIEPGK